MNRARLSLRRDARRRQPGRRSTLRRPAAPPMTSVLAGKKFTPPIKGQADVEFTKPVTKNEKDMVVTTIMVKNTSPAPIARLTVDETWYDKAGDLVAGGKGVHQRPAAAGRSRDDHDRDAVQRRR